MLLQTLTGRLAQREPLAREEMTEAIDIMMRGDASAEEIAAFLLALRAKGETATEIAGAAIAMRKHMQPIRTSRSDVIDTCGTGGVGSTLFNISTTAALVTAACGVPVAKHGNRSVTSKSGSADVLAVLGVNIDASIAVVERCLDELGICFCFAPAMHPAMRHVGPVRRALGVPTIFNLLGPLCNPASATYQVMGVGRDELRPVMADVLVQLGTRHAVVVSGADGMGEISIATHTEVTEVAGGERHDFRWSPADFGLPRDNIESLIVDGPQTSAAKVLGVLNGQPGAARNIVLLNAAAALWTVGKNSSLKVCSELAAAAIDSGAARELLHQLAKVSQS